MAIDTAEKRKSAAGTLGYFRGGPAVTPNSAQDQEWRQEAGYGYPGILAGQVNQDEMVISHISDTLAMSILTVSDTVAMDITHISDAVAMDITDVSGEELG